MDRSSTLYNVHELSEVYVNAFQRIAREVKFEQLSIYFRNCVGDLRIFKGVSLYQYMIMNSQEVHNFGYIWSEDIENLIHEIMGHIAWLFARDLCTRSHQSLGARTCKQNIDLEDPNLRNVKEINYNQFPNSVRNLKFKKLPQERFIFLQKNS